MRLGRGGGVMVCAGVLEQGLSRAEMRGLKTMFLAIRKLNSQVLKQKRRYVSCAKQSVDRMAQGCNSVLDSMLSSQVNQLRPLSFMITGCLAQFQTSTRRDCLFLDTSFLPCLTRARKRIEPLHEGPRSARWRCGLPPSSAPISSFSLS